MKYEIEIIGNGRRIYRFPRLSEDAIAEMVRFIRDLSEHDRATTRFDGCPNEFKTAAIIGEATIELFDYFTNNSRVLDPLTSDVTEAGKI